LVGWKNNSNFGSNAFGELEVKEPNGRVTPLNLIKKEEEV